VRDIRNQPTTARESSGSLTCRRQHHARPAGTSIIRPSMYLPPRLQSSARRPPPNLGCRLDRRIEPKCRRSRAGPRREAGKEGRTTEQVRRPYQHIPTTPLDSTGGRRSVLRWSSKNHCFPSYAVPPCEMKAKMSQRLARARSRSIVVQSAAPPVTANTDPSSPVEAKRHDGLESHIPHAPNPPTRHAPINAFNNVLCLPCMCNKEQCYDPIRAQKPICDTRILD